MKYIRVVVESSHSGDNLPTGRGKQQEALIPIDKVDMFVKGPHGVSVLLTPGFLDRHGLKFVVVKPESLPPDLFKNEKLIEL